MADNTFVLTGLQYAEPTPGDLMRLYIYDKDGKHGGRIFFRNVPKDKREVETREACLRVLEAAGAGQEVRITDSGDMLLFHMTADRDGQVCVAYPPEQGIMTFFAKLIELKP